MTDKTQYWHSVTRYCEEKVRRQGHDIAQLDGIKRIGWMRGLINRRPGY